MLQQNNSSRQYIGFCHLFGLILSIGLGITQYSHALPSDRQQPISIEADNGSLNANSKAGAIRGNVVIMQGTLKLEADSIVSSSSNQKSGTNLITIQGSPARFQQQTDSKNGLAKGQAKTITYNVDTGILTLSGNAQLSQDGASFQGENLRYSMNKGDVEADGGNKGRIKIVLPPSAQQSFSGARD